MLYVLEGTDGPDGAKRRATLRPEHLERIQLLINQGRVIIGGPIPCIDSDDPQSQAVLGSLIIAQFDNLSEAQAWWNNDPYVLGGVFSHTSVRPLRRVVP